MRSKALLSGSGVKKSPQNMARLPALPVSSSVNEPDMLIGFAALRTVMAAEKSIRSGFPPEDFKTHRLLSTAGIVSSEDIMDFDCSRPAAFATTPGSIDNCSKARLSSSSLGGAAASRGSEILSATSTVSLSFRCAFRAMTCCELSVGVLALSSLFALADGAAVLVSACGPSRIFLIASSVDSMRFCRWISRQASHSLKLGGGRVKRREIWWVSSFGCFLDCFSRLFKSTTSANELGSLALQERLGVWVVMTMFPVPSSFMSTATFWS
mmetsp:Transcript_49908/g.103113  ORF Transcript_49908/g.103113 Transcript_49908/m.103113 type:complete len:268 (-) Transcript_49908:953-1756(-)